MVRSAISPCVTFRTRAAELVVGEASAGLEGGDALALLGEPQGRDRTAETGSDDDDVVMVGGIGIGGDGPGCRHG